MNDNADRSTGVVAADAGGAADHPKRLRECISETYLTLEDAKRILVGSSRFEAQEARLLIAEAQGKLDRLFASAGSTEEG